MPKIDVVVLPRELQSAHLLGNAVVVFDVLRATTTMTAALGAGVAEIRIFPDIDSAVAAAASCHEPHILCGERRAVKPAGFDLGNSPGAFSSNLHRGKIVFMTTTNGTHAIIAAAGARGIFIGALTNAQAVAKAVAATGLNITLLCSGTEGFISTEDLLGAGAVIEGLSALGEVELVSDIAWIAQHLFCAQRDQLERALSATRGGHNIRRAGLTPDIAFAANLNSTNTVGAVESQPPVVKRWNATG
jgi:2-phosphosulfolactate phosphatase